MPKSKCSKQHVPLVGAPRQTKPICLFWLHRGTLVPAVRDARYASRDTRPTCGRRAKQTQSYYMSWLQICGALHIEAREWRAKNKANRRGRGPRLGIGDLGLGIRARTTQAARRRCAPNKPNPGRGGLGIDDRLWIIDDCTHARKAILRKGVSAFIGVYPRFHLGFAISHLGFHASLASCAVPMVRPLLVGREIASSLRSSQ
jgi:hypothetical protein